MGLLNAAFCYIFGFGVPLYYRNGTVRLNRFCLYPCKEHTPLESFFLFFFRGSNILGASIEVHQETSAPRDLCHLLAVDLVDKGKEVKDLTDMNS
jgi:hypothetical protein